MVWLTGNVFLFSSTWLFGCLFLYFKWTWANNNFSSSSSDQPEGQERNRGRFMKMDIMNSFILPTSPANTHPTCSAQLISHTRTYIFLSLHDCSLICFITIMWVAFVLLGLEIIQKLLYLVLFFWKENSVFAWYFEWCAVAGGYDVI